MISMAVVLAVVDRTNKQLAIQRQNAGYEEAFNYAQSATEALVNRVSAGDIDPTNPTVNDNLNNQIVSTLNNDYQGQFNVHIDPYNVNNSVPFPLHSDQTLTLKNFRFNKTVSQTQLVDNINILCPVEDVDSNTVSNVAILVQVIFWNGSSYLADNLATTCQEAPAVPPLSSPINGGTPWNSNGGNITSNNVNQYQVSGVNGYQINSTGPHYVNLKYTLTPALNVAYVLTTLKTNFNNNNISPVMNIVANIKNGNALIGSTDPFTGTVIGYGSQQRNSALTFQIPNTSQLPPYLDYSFFEAK